MYNINPNFFSTSNFFDNRHSTQYICKLPINIAISGKKLCELYIFGDNNKSSTSYSI